MFITSTNAAGYKGRCLAPSQHLSKLLFWDTGELSCVVSLLTSVGGFPYVSTYVLF